MSDTDFCPHGFPKNTDNTCIFCERDQLRQRAEAAEDERDKLKIQFGCCSVCGYNAWQERVVNSDAVEVCQYCEMKKERDDAQKACAAMIEVLHGIRQDSIRCEMKEQVIVAIRRVTSGEFGKDYIHKAKVQPLVDALRETLSVCEEMQAVSWLPESDINSKTFDALADQCDAALKQWDNSQNQSTNARAIGSAPSQTPPPHQDGGPVS